MGRFATLNYRNAFGSWVRLDFSFFKTSATFSCGRDYNRVVPALLCFGHDSYTNRDMIFSPSSRM